MDGIRSEVSGSRIHYIDESTGEIFLKEYIPYKMSKSFWDLWFSIIQMIENRYNTIDKAGYTWSYNESEKIAAEHQYDIFQWNENDQQWNEKYIVTKENNRYRIYEEV